MNYKSSNIKGLGFYIPKNKITNEYISKKSIIKKSIRINRNKPDKIKWSYTKTRHRIGLTAGKISYKASRKINPEATRFFNITDVYFKNLNKLYKMSAEYKIINIVNIIPTISPVVMKNLRITASG